MAEQWKALADKEKDLADEVRKQAKLKLQSVVISVKRASVKMSR